MTCRRRYDTTEERGHERLFTGHCCCTVTSTPPPPFVKPCNSLSILSAWRKRQFLCGSAVAVSKSPAVVNRYCYITGRYVFKSIIQAIHALVLYTLYCKLKYDSCSYYQQREFVVRANSAIPSCYPNETRNQRRVGRTSTK